VVLFAKQAWQEYRLGVVQEVLLALMARKPSHGYELRARLQLALGSLAEALNADQVYVTLGRLEKGPPPNGARRCALGHAVPEPPAGEHSCLLSHREL
jgi:hypothetical protein